MSFMLQQISLVEERHRGIPIAMSVMIHITQHVYVALVSPLIRYPSCLILMLDLIRHKFFPK